MKKTALPKSIKSTPKIGDIVHRRPSDLKAWPGNPRTHSVRQLTSLKAGIQQYGFTSSILADEVSVILNGHCRVQAAIELGLATIPTRVISGLSQTEKRALVISDNKIGLLSQWDDPLLKAELEILIQDDFDVQLTGFSTAEIDLMFDESTQSATCDPDDMQPEDEVETPVSRDKDLWQMGNHFLLCADALSANSYEMLMQGQQAMMVITGPPYNVPIAGHVGGNGKVKHREFAMASGEMSPKQFQSFLGKAFSHVHEFAQEGAIVFFFMDWRHIRELQDAAQTLFGSPRQLCVWNKDNAGMGTFYRSQHELVFVFKKGNKSHINNFELGQHGRYRTNVWNYPGANTFKGKANSLLALHPTVKPVSLIADAIRDCSHRKGIILDPFAGSGTILVAAERTGRHARAIELDPQYVDVSIKRWQRVTGKQAVLKATGKTWDQVRADRLSTDV